MWSTRTSILFGECMEYFMLLTVDLSKVARSGISCSLCAYAVSFLPYVARKAVYRPKEICVEC